MRIGWPRFICSEHAAAALLWVGSRTGRGRAVQDADPARCWYTWTASAASPAPWSRRRSSPMSPTSGGSGGASTRCCAWRGSASPISTSSCRRAQQPIVVDVRSPTARALEPRWIPGALHVPLRRCGARHIEELPRDREIVRLLHVSERGIGGARRQDAHQSRLQARATLVRRTRCLDRGGLRCRDRARRRRVDERRPPCASCGHRRRRLRRTGRRAGSGGAGVASPSSISAIIICSSRCSTRSARPRWRPRKSPGRFAICAPAQGSHDACSARSWDRRAARAGAARGRRPLAYDTLVLATGARHAYFGHDEWEPYAPG